MKHHTLAVHVSQNHIGTLLWSIAEKLTLLSVKFEIFLNFLLNSTFLSFFFSSFNKDGLVLSFESQGNMYKHV